MNENKYFNMIKNSSTNAEIFIYGDIYSETYRGESDTSAISFKKELDALGDVKQIDLHINSGGGDVFESYAIYNMLNRHKATIDVYIDGLAASGASVIAMAGKTIHMPENSYLMIHNAWTVASGDYRDLQKSAKVIESITDNLRTAYMTRKLTITESKVKEMMNDETWIAAKQAISFGFADNLLKPSSAAASIDTSILNQYRNVPGTLKQTASAQGSRTKPAAPGQKKGNSTKNVRKFMDTLANAVTERADRMENRSGNDLNDEENFRSGAGNTVNAENTTAYCINDKFFGGRLK
ncbi:head maturation protease, ClpP-related [uncultured Trichococcus sp.]|uniref:head maturation protease, ClpP-related n=1 Tax=uncultured Trichococcus sp. TaxID=189665 RepID=UPI002A187D68|nr:head maturation protease, ClpP-related [uncultured Trichococcus sp.]